MSPSPGRGHGDGRDQPPVGIVVLNYATSEDTIACVRRVAGQAYRNWDLIVVDNASPDGSETRLRQALPGVAVVQRGRNRGYGDGNNFGIELALAGGAELVWIVSPDVRVEPDCLVRMVALMKRHPDVGLCGPVMRTGDRLVLRWELFERLGYQAWARPTSEAALAGRPDRVDTGFVEGGAILIRRRVIHDIGAFRTDFFLYYEECEYCLRARDAGWGLAVCAGARAETRASDPRRHARYYYMTRNSIVLARLRRRYVARTVARHLLLLPVQRWWRSHDAAQGLQAIRDGLRMPLGNGAV